MLNSQSNKPSVPQPETQPTQPTMTNASLIPPLETPPVNSKFPAELAEDIVARPLTLPDFVNVPLANPALSARWIFTDRRRFSQAKAQGWRVAQKRDIKPGYAALTPYEEEGGTKYINGDLILMVIDRKIYLGALRYKHQVAAAIADSSMLRRVGASRAAHDMGSTVAAVNQAWMQQGRDPAMTVFTPGTSELHGPMANADVAAKELGRLGSDVRDMGSLADLAKKTE